ncbi:hypothetical protein [Pseudoalteromonas sp. TAE56]|uniref:hypothetical protein n=1 Tax=Pseudoalteromonas sp. TAE56 TaxID=1938596 RepID=UPI000463451B|nr:hypothetical protein [Pseudoalteromonas sp. TAE56]
MRYISRVSTKILSTNRQDAEYYSPHFLEVERKVKSHSFGYDSLSNLVYDLKDGPGGWGVSTNDYTDTGVPIIRGVNINDSVVNLEKAIFISEDKHEELKAHEVLKGDVVLTVRGSVGRSGVFQSRGYGYANLNAAVVRMRCKKNRILPYYLVSFFNCKHGRLQSSRISNGAVQNNMNLTETGSNLIPTPSLLVQQYIGNKIRFAELLKRLSKLEEKKLELKIEQIFSQSTKPKNSNLGRKIKNKELTENRLDPQYYGSVELWAENKIQEGKYPYKSLSELTNRIKDGPGGWGVSTNDYKPSGVPVIRSINLVDGECDLSDCVYISVDKHKELKNHEAKPNSVLLSVRGTIGRAAVFNDEHHKTANLNAAVVTIDCKSELNPYYLSAFFNSEIGRIQANRIANGAVQLNMNLTETASNLIPLPPETVQLEIELAYKMNIDSKRIVSSLISASSLIVEALIDGQVTESQLIEAQQALEEGDNSKDRAILSKLTDKGYLADDGKPLFTDLDKLYELLDEAKQAVDANEEPV